MESMSSCRQWTGGAWGSWCMSCWPEGLRLLWMAMRTLILTLQSKEPLFLSHTHYYLEVHLEIILLHRVNFTALLQYISGLSFVLTGELWKKILHSLKRWDPWPKTSSSDYSLKIQRRGWAQGPQGPKMWKAIHFTRYEKWVIFNVKIA